MLNTKKGNEKKYGLVIFVNSVSGRFWPGARFSKVPITFRIRNQIFKSK